MKKKLPIVKRARPFRGVVSPQATWEVSMSYDKQGRPARLRARVSRAFWKESKRERVKMENSLQRAMGEWADILDH